MRETLIFFDSVEDIEKLTGLTSDELWNLGFNLDDLDWGFVTDNCEYIKHITDDYGYDYSEINYEATPQYMEQILSMMDDYCVGFSTVKYNNKLWITLHHA